MPRVPGGPEPHINFVGNPRERWRRQQMDNALTQTHKKGAAINTARTIGHLT